MGHCWIAGPLYSPSCNSVCVFVFVCVEGGGDWIASPKKEVALFFFSFFEKLAGREM